MRCDVQSSVCSRLSPGGPRLHEGLCDSARAFFGSMTSISAEASHECMGREEATAGWKQREETAGCCPSPVLPTGVDGPRAAASRLAATQGTRGAARICSGGREEVGEEWTAWCLNCNQHSGSRLHQEGSHEFMGQDVVQGVESGSRGQVLLDEQSLPGSRDVDETGAWRDPEGTLNLPNLGHLSASHREVVGHACPACRRVSSVGGLTSFPLCVQPLETPIAPREVDRDASPSAGRWEHLGETFALQNMGPKDDVCPYLFATLRQKPLAIVGAPLDGRASPAGPCVRLERSSKGSKVAESSLGPKGAALELLPAALHTPSVLADERDPARGSPIPPAVLCVGRLAFGPLGHTNVPSLRRAAWALSGKTRNRLAHAYNGNIITLKRGEKVVDFPPPTNGDEWKRFEQAVAQAFRVKKETLQISSVATAGQSSVAIYLESQLVDGQTYTVGGADLDSGSEGLAGYAVFGWSKTDGYFSRLTSACNPRRSLTQAQTPSGSSPSAAVNEEEDASGALVPGVGEEEGEGGHDGE
uniref:Uncharacterized protein n=1 Tax=Chromera velia CCMP2878 TaxID=1169474 RepID=A0A0G4GYU7_9ALVE|eukprot:Cvel_23966.t1-p1 / transcript=Cvel_23966.t1 / gene=Cvel_23966 / organism=Chromera_velia_CCMP2878 / gene_product=hypothetical protein / transcript_product=hypothetical protein / location=Cvel_scaffold2535:6509-11973(-) / protein_length=529 / sequence_SO=supercontig / SO=protein_coding / is_pseudo=false